MNRKITLKVLPYLLSFIMSSLLFEVKATAITFHGDITLDSSYVDNQVLSKNITRGLFNAGAEIDLTEFFKYESSFIAGYAIQRGDNGSDIVGDIQGFSNIDEADFTRAFEIFLAVKFSENSLVKLGQMDANSDFATTASGSEFINSSFGFSPSIQQIPTYPRPSVGIYGEVNLNSQMTARLGLYESSQQFNHFTDFFSIAEAQWYYQGNSTFKIGVWHHSGLKFNNQPSKSTSDIYVVVDHQLNEKVSAFLQWGRADTSLVEINRHLSLGINIQNIFTEADSLGLALTQVDVVEADSERAIELFYSYKVNDYLTVKPDIQLISAPSGNNALDEVIVFTLRLAAQF